MAVNNPTDTKYKHHAAGSGWSYQVGGAGDRRPHRRLAQGDEGVRPVRAPGATDTQQVGVGQPD